MPIHVTISRFAELSGYTETAIRQKIHKGIWPEGVWIKAPDGRILVNQEEYDEWAINGQVQKPQVHPASKSVSFIKGNAAVKNSSSSPPPLI